MSQLLSWEAIEAMERGAYRILLYGPPGTGKTRSAFETARTLGKSLYNCTLTDETPAAELRGHFVPQGDKWMFMYGPATRAFVEGAVLCLDEIDKASQDCLDFLHGLLNDPELARLTLPNGEIVTPKPGFQVIATMNGELSDLQPSLQDRFSIAIEVSEPHPNAILSLPKDLQGAARNFESYESSERPSTIRRWSAFASLRDVPGISVEDAAKAVFAHRASELMDAYNFRSYRPNVPALEDMSKRELLAEAERIGVSKTGTKAELIAKIEAKGQDVEHVDDHNTAADDLEPCSCQSCTEDRARGWMKHYFGRTSVYEDDNGEFWCPNCGNGAFEDEYDAIMCCYDDEHWVREARRYEYDLTASA